MNISSSLTFGHIILKPEWFPEHKKTYTEADSLVQEILQSDGDIFVGTEPSTKDETNIFVRLNPKSQSRDDHKRIGTKLLAAGFSKVLNLFVAPTVDSGCQYSFVVEKASDYKPQEKPKNPLWHFLPDTQ